MIDLTRARAIYYEALDTKNLLATADRADSEVTGAVDQLAGAAARLTLAYMSTDPELAGAIATAVEHRPQLAA